MSTNDNPPAFPTIREYSYSQGVGTEHVEGMTLRDYFAAAALNGRLSVGELKKGATYAQLAEEAYEFAGAMLVERAKRKEGT